MEAISNKTGRKITGKLAEIFVRKGLASPLDGSYVPPKKVAAKPPKKRNKPPKKATEKVKK